MLKIDAKLVALSIIQAYAPTTGHTDDAIDEFYEQLEKARRQCKPGEVTIVMGDMNAKVGDGRSGGVVGAFGLGEIKLEGIQVGGVVRKLELSNHEHNFQTLPQVPLHSEEPR